MIFYIDSREAFYFVYRLISTTKMEQYCGSTTGLNYTDALKQAVDHTLGVVKRNNPPLLASFARKMAVDSTMSTGYNLAKKGGKIKKKK